MAARTQFLESDIAAKLAFRLQHAGVDLARADEANRPPGDRSPEFANLVMNQPAQSVAAARNLTEAEWTLVGKALQHYAECPNVATAASG